MRPAERSKKYKRATVFAASSAVSDLEALEDDIESFIPSLLLSFMNVVFGRSALIWLDESAEAGNGLCRESGSASAEGALVGVESFRIHEEPPDVVLSGDAVAASSSRAHRPSRDIWR